MVVGVIDAGDHQPATQVDFLRRIGLRLHFGIRPHGDYSISARRNGLRPRSASIAGEDATIEKQEIHPTWPRLARCGEQQQH
jgi:hypothetical protein